MFNEEPGMEIESDLIDVLIPVHSAGLEQIKILHCYYKRYYKKLWYQIKMMFVYLYIQTM